MHIHYEFLTADLIAVGPVLVLAVVLAVLLAVLLAVAVVHGGYQSSSVIALPVC